MLLVSVWDRGMAGAVEKAIREANLGLNPISEGATLRVPIPELNAERRKELVKVAHKYAEAARVAVRHVRRDGIDSLKKALKDGMSEDEEARLQDKVQKLTDETIVEIDKLLAAKEQDITKV
jgi:ribosome recycling factor